MRLNLKDTSHEPSLIPYLEASRGNFYLNLSQDPTIAKKILYPFLIISDSDPLVRLIEGQLITDAGSEIKKVFLLMQRDHYRLSQGEWWLMNNRSVDSLWQKAFTFYSRKSIHSPLMILTSQINEKGGLRPFQPLLFCNTRHLFFSPLCPKCGEALDQCEEDDLLTRSGLPPYSKSLRRYLYCSSCSSKGQSDFYVYELEPSDPPQIKDRWTLFKEFRQLLRDQRNHHSFPCMGCAHREECFGETQMVLSRILPFSFYPFYLLIFEAFSLNGSDFLFLLSGATIEEIESLLESRKEIGRLNCLKTIKPLSQGRPLYFDARKDPTFIEILYLKLTFLEEVIQNLLSDIDPFSHPDLRFSLDQIWVKLSEAPGLLPFFWNFRAGFLDITTSPQGIRLPTPLSSSTWFFLGCLWFFALLANKMQDFIKVSHALRETIIHSLSDQDFSNPVYYPENIFWNPEGKKVEPGWLPLWERALHLGYSLLSVSFQHDLKWNREGFIEELENLREEVKRQLFKKEPTERVQIRPTEVRSQDESIHRILMGILYRWQTEVGQKEKGPSREEEIPETVIIKPPKTKLLVEEEATRVEGQLKGEETIQGDEFLAETVILGSEKRISKPPPKGPQKAVGVKEEAFLKKETQSKLTEKTEEEDFLSETVILGSRKDHDQGRDGKKG